MSDIDILLDQLGEYSNALTGVAGRTRQLASEATVFTSTTGRADSASAAAGLTEHLDALLGDIATALDRDTGEVSGTRGTLLAVDQAIGDVFGSLL